MPFAYTDLLVQIRKSPPLLLEVVGEEAAVAAPACGGDGRIEDMLEKVAERTWTPNAAGIGLDPYDTIAGALWCLAANETLRDALVTAVRMGGDTDKVAALIGGLLGCQLVAEDVRAQLASSEHVLAPDGDLLQRLAEGIAKLRIGGADG
jgi:ADP-ribosylglycohydrolase